MKEKTAKLKQEYASLIEPNVQKNLNNPIVSVDKILEDVKKKTEESIANEELTREKYKYISMSNPAIVNPDEIISQYSKTGSWMLSKYDFTILGKNVETYNEEIQCNIYDEVKAEIEDEIEEQSLNPTKDKERNNVNNKKKQGFTRKAEVVVNPFKTFLNTTLENDQGKKMSSTDLPQLNTKQEEMKKKLLYSSEIVEFIQKNSKYIERSLCENEIIDLLNKEVEEEKENEKEAIREKENNYNEQGLLEKERHIGKLGNESILSSIGVFYDDVLTSKRVVNDIQWSSKHPEILLTGYSKSEESNINDPHGLVLLWSLAMRKKPEFQFTCQSEVTTAIFNPFNQNMIIGATYTGQILVWDTRGKSLPVSKTPPGGKFHSHPVYCLSVTGSANNCNIMSISNDGVLCTWSMNNFNKTTKRIELKGKKRKVVIDDPLMSDSKIVSNSTNQYQDEFGILCMTSQENESNTVYIGTDDSQIYQVYAHQNPETDNIVDAYNGHSGPILSLDMHKEDFYKSTNVSKYIIIIYKILNQ